MKNFLLEVESGSLPVMAIVPGVREDGGGVAPSRQANLLDRAQDYINVDIGNRGRCTSQFQGQTISCVEDFVAS